MPKYYIKSGDIKLIIDKPNHDQAIMSALQLYKNSNKIASHKICISEQGFEDFKNWICYDTYNFTKRLNK